MTASWTRKDDSEAAIAAILEGADKCFSQIGVAKSGMNEIAGAAGCSRGTIYHHFKNRHELHIAYVRHVAGEIRETIMSRADHTANIPALILLVLKEVRKRPGAIAWFAPGEVVRMGKSAEIQSILVDDLVEINDGNGRSSLQEKWIIRVIISFLTDPGESHEEEEKLLHAFMIPGQRQRD